MCNFRFFVFSLTVVPVCFNFYYNFNFVNNIMCRKVNSLKHEGLSGGGSTDCLDLQTLFLCCDSRCSLSFSELGKVVSLLQYTHGKRYELFFAVGNLLVAAILLLSSQQPSQSFLHKRCNRNLFSSFHFYQLYHSQKGHYSDFIDKNKMWKLFFFSMSLQCLTEFL